MNDKRQSEIEDLRLKIINMDTIINEAIERAEKAEADRDRYEMLWQEGERRVAGTEMIYAEAKRLEAEAARLRAALNRVQSEIDAYYAEYDAEDENPYVTVRSIADLVRETLAGISSSDNATEAP